ncbi:hypothetical protein VHUM_00295 [Vanrija humicola]|uniref:Glucose-methanol-choline oxidoreductase N-terminal domain-containing protein n=1 Tax=Vanrija humicola TaxID=5417 RepID=A0A7D8V475_VANHU|nr:hypothetical protein VHUM_00295 [Vanrija humicola]
MLLALAPLLLGLLAPVGAVTPITDGAAVNGQTYDYVVVGGGLTGIVLATRLSEDSSRRVLVIEAGKDEEGNPDVTQASAYQRAFDTPVDWAFRTVNQNAANGQATTVRQGKGLGGSTLINGMAWSKPHSFQIDALETLGNAGLNWASLQPYMLRAENFRAPSAAQAGAGVTYSSSCHRTGGPIGVQFDTDFPGDLERNFNATALGKGVPYATDLTCGNPAGLAPIAHTKVDNLRSNACGLLAGGTADGRPRVLTGANVGKVLLSSASTPRATGIEFRDQAQRTFSASASREVIVAAGAIKTPLILQQSGIGPRAFLQAAGIAVRVDLPVGQNLIDQVTTTTNWGFWGNRGGNQPIVFPRFQDLFSGAEKTTATNLLQTKLAAYAQDAVNAGAFSSAAGLEKILGIQRDWILNKGAGVSENYDYSYDTTLGYDSWFLLPFGRGSVRVTDSNPYGGGFSIDPRFFANEFDTLAVGATARFTRTVSTGSPLNGQITGEYTPGSGVGSSASAWANWAKNNYRSNWHPIGTAAMISRDLGGSVDSRNRVYGVAGLRVVDSSTLPIQVSSHLMSVLYGLAERAAELIKADNAGSGGTTAPPTSSSTRPPVTSTTAPPTPSGKAIRPGRDASKCLEVQWGALANGTPVNIATCNGSARQRFDITPGSTAIKVTGSNFCLDAGSAPASGTRMKIWQCYAGLPAQSWTFTPGGPIALQVAGQCLDLTDGSLADGNTVQTWQCFANNDNQKWTTA